MVNWISGEVAGVLLLALVSGAPVAQIDMVAAVLKTTVLTLGEEAISMLGEVRAHGARRDMLMAPCNHLATNIYCAVLA